MENVMTLKQDIRFCRRSMSASYIFAAHMMMSILWGRFLVHACPNLALRKARAQLAQLSPESRADLLSLAGVRVEAVKIAREPE
jgi:hypothetical protein